MATSEALAWLTVDRKGVAVPVSGQQRPWPVRHNENPF